MQIFLKYYTTIIFALNCFNAIGQEEYAPKVDSLLIELSNTKNDTLKAGTFIAIGMELNENNPDISLNYINEAFKIYESLSETFNVAASLNMKALI